MKILQFFCFFIMNIHFAVSQNGLVEQLELDGFSTNVDTLSNDKIEKMFIENQFVNMHKISFVRLFFNHKDSLRQFHIVEISYANQSSAKSDFKKRETFFKMVNKENKWGDIFKPHMYFRVKNNLYYINYRFFNSIQKENFKNKLKEFHLLRKNDSTIKFGKYFNYTLE